MGHTDTPGVALKKRTAVKTSGLPLPQFESIIAVTEKSGDRLWLSIRVERNSKFVRLRGRYV
jgi:hypothetical protein